MIFFLLRIRRLSLLFLWLVLSLLYFEYYSVDSFEIKMSGSNSKKHVVVTSNSSRRGLLPSRPIPLREQQKVVQKQQEDDKGFDPSHMDTEVLISFSKTLLNLVSLYIVILKPVYTYLDLTK